MFLQETSWQDPEEDWHQWRRWEWQQRAVEEDRTWEDWHQGWRERTEGAGRWEEPWQEQEEAPRDEEEEQWGDLWEEIPEEGTGEDLGEEATAEDLAEELHGEEREEIQSFTQFLQEINERAANGAP